MSLWSLIFDQTPVSDGNVQVTGLNGNSDLAYLVRANTSLIQLDGLGAVKTTSIPVDPSGFEPENPVGATLAGGRVVFPDVRTGRPRLVLRMAGDATALLIEGVILVGIYTDTTTNITSMTITGVTGNRIQVFKRRNPFA